MVAKVNANVVSATHMVTADDKTSNALLCLGCVQFEMPQLAKPGRQKCDKTCNHALNASCNVLAFGMLFFMTA